MKYQEIAKRQKKSEKRGRSKNKHENEKGDEKKTENDEFFKSYIISQRTFRKHSIPLSLFDFSRRFFRFKNAVSRLKRKTKKISKNNEKVRYFEKMMNEILQFTSKMFEKIITSTKIK